MVIVDLQRLVFNESLFNINHPYHVNVGGVV